MTCHYDGPDPSGALLIKHGSELWFEIIAAAAAAATPSVTLVI